MLEYDFMRTAFLAAFLVAVVCGPVGWFLVLRGQTFASHALSHVGFAGATGALLIGLSPLTGLTAGALGAGVLMGLAGDRVAGRDVMIGLVLSVAMGAGALFLHFLTHSASAATALLFGDILGISSSMLGWLAILSGGAFWRWGYGAPSVICFLAARTGGSQRCADGIAGRAVSGSCCHCYGGMRPDNWRFTGFHADGCACRGHSPPGSATFCWAAGGCGFGCGGSVGGLCSHGRRITQHPSGLQCWEE